MFALPALVTGATPLEGLEMGNPVHEAAHAWLFRQADPERIVFAARCMTIALGTAMLGGLAALAWRHFGPLAAVAAVAAVACDPTALGHFSLVSTDALVAAAVIGCLTMLDWWSRRPGVIPAGCVGAALGMAFLCKFTAVALGPAVLVYAWLHRRAITAPRLRTAAIQAVACGLVAIAVIWLGYGAHLKGAFPRVAFPGLQAGLEQSRIYAVGGMPSFFCGWIGWHHPWYFLLAPLVKLPVPLLLLWIVGGAVALASPARTSPLVMAAGLAAICFFTSFAASRLCIGVRHLLPAFVVLPVLVAAAVGALRTALPRRRLLVGAVFAILFAWLGVEAVSTAPNQLSYFNQLAGGPRGGMRLLGDSNLDWGQDLKTLRRTMDRLGLDEVILSYFGNTDPAFYGIR